MWSNLDKVTNKKVFLEKEKRVNDEIARLKKIFKDLDLDEKRMAIANSSIENLAFMTITLEDLQSDINANGVTSKYKNGENQWGTKQSDEVKTYISLINRFNSVNKTLLDLLPKEKQKEAKDGFGKFVESRPD